MAKQTNKMVSLIKQNQIREITQVKLQKTVLSLRWAPHFFFASHSTGLNDGFRTPDITGTYPSPKTDLSQDDIINYSYPGKESRRTQK